LFTGALLSAVGCLTRHGVRRVVRADLTPPFVWADYKDVRAEVLEIVDRVNASFSNAIAFVELPTIALAQRMQARADSDDAMTTSMDRTAHRYAETMPRWSTLGVRLCACACACAYACACVCVDLLFAWWRRVQLWALADVAVCTPLREGVSTYPLEAVYARREGPPGIVVLSEFCSCARVLNGALRVNPWNTEETSHAFERACVMGTAERLARRERDMHFLRQTTATTWAERFFVDLVNVTQRADEEWTPLGFGLAVCTLPSELSLPRRVPLCRVTRSVP
jgi:hypothetical protein